jgi:S1-C subfamily serine protease
LKWLLRNSGTRHAAGRRPGAGLEEGDIVVALNGQDVSSVDDLHRYLAEWPIGQEVRLTIIRGREKREIGVVPGEAGDLARRRPR